MEGRHSDAGKDGDRDRTVGMDGKGANDGGSVPVYPTREADINGSSPSKRGSSKPKAPAESFRDELGCHLMESWPASTAATTPGNVITMERRWRVLKRKGPEKEAEAERSDLVVQSPSN